MSEAPQPPSEAMDLTFSGMQEQMEAWGEPRFRAQQLWKWLYVHLADDFTQMHNLPGALRDKLKQTYRANPLIPVDERISSDRFTRKVLFALPDGQTVETVLMEYDQRQTVCVSSQVGCAIGCTFCATGQSGFVRNLKPAEIIAQPLYFARQLRTTGDSLSNIVVMGMGEPLLNYEAVWQAVETWNDRQGMNVGARKITLSTAGYVPGIRRLSKESLQVGLAVSVHAAEDALRDRLVPLNRRYPLAELISACHEYVERTGRRISIEYALVRGVNDSVSQAHELARLLQGLSCHVNLIPLNPTPNCEFRPSPLQIVRAFQRALTDRRIPTTLRLKRGVDVEAGCGQLRQRQLQA